MKLSQVFATIPNCQMIGDCNILIQGMSANSKTIRTDYLFIAKKGQNYTGDLFVAEAVQNGAKAILTTQVFHNLPQITQIIHPDPAAIEAKLAATFYDYPAKELCMVGITGTSGKSTTSYIVKHLLEQSGVKCGLIGGIEILTGKSSYEPTHTTPDAVTNQHLLREMIDHGCASCVMEVTSHALFQGRVNEIDFDVAVFTNLTPEHLDYHVDMEAYALAKKRLFSSQPRWAVVNNDDPWTSTLLDDFKGNILTFGLNDQADLWASEIILLEGRTLAKIHYQGKILDFIWPLVGRFNVYNCLAAMGVALTQGYSLASMIEKMQMLQPVQGRLEIVPNDLGLKIYVDHSHKADALANALKTLNEFKTGRLITIFGCGGDRDQLKRPLMAQVAEEYSDFTIVTNDNPRTEDPKLICEAILKGFKRSDSHVVELDRRSAIRIAVEKAVSADLILIAGKGHETYQLFNCKTLEFDDRKVASEVCSEIDLARKSCVQ